MAYLVVLKGQNAKQSISLDKDRVVLGRNANCDVVFPANDFAVSREHACILRVQSKFFIEDLGSRNGTYVNNQPVTNRQPLNDSDKIRICDFLYSFHETAPASRPPLPGNEPEPTIDEPDDFSTFEASVSHSSQVFLESQPAERLRAILEITNILSKTHDVDSLLPKIVDILFGLFKQADRAFIILRDEVTERDKTVERLIPKVIKTRRTQDESSASYSRSIVRECLKTLQAFLSDDATQDKRFNMSQSIADFRIRSVMCAPLCPPDSNKAFGVIQLDTQDRSKKFTQDDLNLLMAVASQAANVLENARLHESALAREREQEQLALAYQVQLSFLPRKEPELAGYEFFQAYEPAQTVGGDYFGFIPLPGPPAQLAITVGDVAGKGVPAALLMAKLASDARFSLVSEHDPAKAITVLNDLLYPNTSQMDRFVTLAVALLDPRTHTVTLVNAGHPCPLLIRSNAAEPSEASLGKSNGLPLGVMEGYAYESHQLVLEPGDSLLLYSDGMTDAMDKENHPLGLKAVHSALKDGARTPRALGERIMKILKQHATGRNQHDDITLVCFGRNVS
jgi:serine phosphatase RsbU (regulator of sigma subunit)